MRAKGTSVTAILAQILRVRNRHFANSLFCLTSHSKCACFRGESDSQGPKRVLCFGVDGKSINVDAPGETSGFPCVLHPGKRRRASASSNKATLTHGGDSAAYVSAHGTPAPASSAPSWATPSLILPTLCGSSRQTSKGEERSRPSSTKRLRVMQAGEPRESGRLGFSPCNSGRTLCYTHFASFSPYWRTSAAEWDHGRQANSASQPVHSSLPLGRLLLQHRLR